MTDNEEDTKLEETYSDFVQIDPSKSGTFIKDLRLSHNLTQEALAEKLFVSRKAVSKWENGLSSPSLDILKNLSVYFSVSIDEIVDGDFGIKKVEIVPDYKITMNTFKHNKKFSFVSVLLIFSAFNLSIFYMDNKEGTELYSLNGFSNNFGIQNGTILTLGNKSYLSYGTFFADILKKYYDTETNLSFYYLKHDKKVNIKSYETNIQKLMDLNSLSGFYLKNLKNENMYLDVYTKYNDTTEKVKLDMELIYDGDKSYSGEKASEYYNPEMDSISRNSLLDNSVYNKEAELKEIVNILDISFLLEQNEEFYKKLVGKKITFNNSKFTILVSDCNKIIIKSKKINYILLDFNKKIVCLSKSNNNIIIFNIENKYLTFNEDNNIYFNIAKSIIECLDN